MAGPDSRIALQWLQRQHEAVLYADYGADSAAGLQVVDAPLILWFLALAEQGIVTAADRAALQVTGTDAEVLAVGQFLRDVRTMLGWPVATFPHALAAVCERRSLRSGIQVLAQGWPVHHDT